MVELWPIHAGRGVLLGYRCWVVWILLVALPSWSRGPRTWSRLAGNAAAVADLGLVIGAPRDEYVPAGCGPQPLLWVFRLCGGFRFGDLGRGRTFAWAVF